MIGVLGFSLTGFGGLGVNGWSGGVGISQKIVLVRPEGAAYSLRTRLGSFLIAAR